MSADGPDSAPEPTPHRYLSTGCFHGDQVVTSDGASGHDYCGSMTGFQGEKRPGRCKFCDAQCVCPCHYESEESR